jgi:hypothetical protein
MPVENATGSNPIDPSNAFITIAAFLTLLANSQLPGFKISCALNFIVFRNYLNNRYFEQIK